VVVVDDGSSTARGVIEPMEAENVVVVEQPASGPAAARNHGAAVARGAWVAFLDDDCAPDPTWLARLGRALESDPTSIVGGVTVNALTTNAFATASQVIVDYVVAAGARRDSDEVAFLPSSNLALQRDAFLGVGGFDATFATAGGEDREFCERVRAQGHRLRLIAAAVVHHRHELGPVTFWSQHYRYGRGAYRLRRNYRRQSKLVPERPSFYGRLLAASTRIERPWPYRLLVVMLLAVSQIATASGVAAEAAAGGRRLPLWARR
jgi:GT2 family glycosyltransferase